jgi:WD40 repeat protein
MATEVEAASIAYMGVRLWTFATGHETLLTADGGGWLTYSPDGNVLATENADGANVRFWDTRTRRLITTLNFPSTPTGAVPLDAMSTLAFSPDGRKFAVPDGNNTQVWDLGAG